MRLTTFTDYALRVLIYVAARNGERATIADIARGFDISENHLTKVVHFLGRRGLLANLRGRGGGLRLAVPAREINVAAVVRVAEGTARPVACFDRAASGCAIASVCRLRLALDDAVQAFYRVLEQYTLEDLVHGERRLATILFAPAPAD